MYVHITIYISANYNMIYQFSSLYSQFVLSVILKKLKVEQLQLKLFKMSQVGS